MNTMNKGINGFAFFGLVLLLSGCDQTSESTETNKADSPPDVVEEVSFVDIDDINVENGVFYLTSGDFSYSFNYRSLDDSKSDVRFWDNENKKSLFFYSFDGDDPGRGLRLFPDGTMISSDEKRIYIKPPSEEWLTVDAPRQPNFDVSSIVFSAETGQVAFEAGYQDMGDEPCRSEVFLMNSFHDDPEVFTSETEMGYRFEPFQFLENGTSLAGELFPCQTYGAPASYGLSIIDLATKSKKDFFYPEAGRAHVALLNEKNSIVNYYPDGPKGLEGWESTELDQELLIFDLATGDHQTVELGRDSLSYQGNRFQWSATGNMFYLLGDSGLQSFDVPTRKSEVLFTAANVISYKVVDDSNFLIRIEENDQRIDKLVNRQGEEILIIAVNGASIENSRPTA